MSLQKPKAVHVASKLEYSTAGREVQVHWVSIHEVTESGTRRLKHGLMK